MQPSAENLPKPAQPQARPAPTPADDAAAALADVDRMPLAERPAVFDRVHADLKQALAEIDGV